MLLLIYSIILSNDVVLLTKKADDDTEKGKPKPDRVSIVSRIY